jgi:hypothetical protein
MSKRAACVRRQLVVGRHTVCHTLCGTQSIPQINIKPTYVENKMLRYVIVSFVHTSLCHAFKYVCTVKQHFQRLLYLWCKLSAYAAACIRGLLTVSLDVFFRGLKHAATYIQQLTTTLLLQCYCCTAE